MTTEQEASPVIDMTVRPMSTIRSMPATMATHSTGIWAEANTIAVRARKPSLPTFDTSFIDRMPAVSLVKRAPNQTFP